MIELKTFIVWLGFICLALFFIPLKVYRKPFEEIQFDDFIRKYNKTYQNETIYRYKLKAFNISLDTINKLNGLRKSNTSAIYGVTKYSDLYPNEFIDNQLQNNYSKFKLVRDLKVTNDSSSESNDSNPKKLKLYKRSTIPTKVDWRTKGVVSTINNQHACGACWAFSIIETVESMNAIKTGKLIKLSTQQMIDCAGYNNDGCNGGDMCSLLEWMNDTKVKVLQEVEYPLHLRNEKCIINQSNGGVQIDNYACDELINDEDFIVQTLANLGPVAVAINALSWQNYLEGIIQYHCNPHPLLLNHAVQIVGYDMEAEIPHYIVRNSWGTDFGDQGYLYIAIGTNLCGLASEVSALTVL